MAKLMKCFVMHGVGNVGMMDKPIPRAGPSDAIIRTTAALICTSDTHTVAGAIGDRHGLTLGHEAVGVIHELGGEGRKRTEGAIHPWLRWGALTQWTASRFASPRATARTSALAASLSVAQVSN